jgi:hypothetical protein
MTALSDKLQADFITNSFAARQAAFQKKELLIVTVLSVAFGVSYSIHAGQDVNWDWQNYHDYDVLALLYRRGEVDVAPAGIQTFLNPVPYVPFYLLRHLFPPILGAAMVGAVQALNFPIAWILMRRLIPDLSLLAMTATMVISASGAMTLSEIGTSFADLLTAIPVLIGITLLLPSGPRRPRAVLIAGVFIGAAVGLKLTNSVFAIGAVAMILCGERPLRFAGWFGLGGALGALATGGAWSLYLWQEFQNPFFPFYNSIFHSAAGPSWNAPRTVPYRFPQGILDALGYPFRWVVDGNTTAEATFRDARFAVILIVAGISVCVAAVRRHWIFSRRETQLGIFFAASLSLWMVMFSTQRFVIVLEILAGPMIALLLHRTAPVMARNIITAVTAVALALWVKPSEWGHRPWTNVYSGSLAAGALQNPASYFLVDKPLAFAIWSFPTESRFYQLSDGDLPITMGTPLDRRIREGLAHPLPGGEWVMLIKGNSIPSDSLRLYGLEIDNARACVTLAGAASDLAVCPLRKSQDDKSH